MSATVDSDGDGLPDVIDWRPSDPLNGMELVGAGGDGLFGTGDDVIDDPRASYDGNTRVNVTIADGPLPPGEYRLTVTDTVTDLVGNALDGDRDGAAGGDFVQFFTIDDLPPDAVLEQPFNNSRGSATPLTLVQDVVEGSVLYTEMYGIGSQDPAAYRNNWSDEDYWSFQAEAGDYVSISVSTPDSGVDPYVELYNGSSRVASDDNGGPDNDSLISGYQIPSDGTYHVRVGKYYWSSVAGTTKSACRFPAASRWRPTPNTTTTAWAMPTASHSPRYRESVRTDGRRDHPGQRRVRTGTKTDTTWAFERIGQRGRGDGSPSRCQHVGSAGIVIGRQRGCGPRFGRQTPRRDVPGDRRKRRYLLRRHSRQRRCGGGSVLHRRRDDHRPGTAEIRGVNRLPLPLAGSDAYRDGVIGEDPSVYLRLSEASGTTLADSSGHPGGPLDATVTGSPAHAQSGPFGDSGDPGLRIGGDSHIEVPDGERVDDSRQIAFSFWMNADSFANTWMPVVFKGTTSSSQRSYALWLRNNGRLYFSTSDSSGRQEYNTGSNGLISPGSWNHIAGSVNRDTGRIKLWVNGVERIDGGIRTGDIRQNGNPLLIGQTYENSSSYSRFAGRIDEFALWTEAKTSNELLAPYFDSKWLGEPRSSENLISTFSFDVSEKLISRSVNHQGWDFDTFGGNTYVKLSSRRWVEAQDWAESNGGHLAIPDTADENEFLWQRFSDPPNDDLWIGLSDEPAEVAGASEGDWKTVLGADDSTVHDGWVGSEPNSGNGYDYAYLHYGNGGWYDGWQTWNKHAVVEFVGDADSDGDGLPDVIDWRPSDPLNGMELVGAGGDGLFGTGDDVIDDPRASYDGNTRVNVTIADGPLPPGEYRLTVTDTVTDLVGNALDGDRDGAAGGDFVQFFTIDGDPDAVYENAYNGSLSGATPLELVESPAGSGHFLTVNHGAGSQDPAAYRNNWSDVDYWSFEALAGDRVAIAVDTPASSVDPYVELRNSSNSVIGGSSPDGATDDNSGPGNDSYISHFTIPSDGTYYIRVGKSYWSSAVGNYEVRVQATRGIDLESDAEYTNDSIGGADSLTYSPSGNQRNATIAGTVMSGQSGNVDEDYFALGTIEAGETVFSRVTLPSASTLLPVIEIRDSDDQVVSINPNPTDASIARYDIDTTGQYYAVILDRGGQGPDAQYLLDSTIGPTSELQFSDLSVSAVTLPDPPEANSGDTISISWTVGNFGTAPTDVTSWFDRVVLSENDTYGDGDDRYVGSFLRTGALEVGQSYTASADVTLPLDASGPRRVFVETDEQGGVFEFTLTDNNVTASDLLNITRSPLPDLEVQNLAVSGPDADGQFDFSWQTANTGDGPANADFAERFRATNLDSGQPLVDAPTPVTGGIAVAGSVAGSGGITIAQPGPYAVTVTTDSDDDLFEYNAGGHLGAEQNNSTTLEFSATTDLLIENVSVFPPDPEPGDTLIISWDTLNAGNIAAAAAFHDRVQITRLASPAQALAAIVISDQNVPQSGGMLGPGQSRQSSIQVALPDGINGVGEIQVRISADRFDAVGEYLPSADAEQNNQTDAVVTSTSPFADLVPTIEVAPAQGDIDRTIDIAWSVLNDAANASGETPGDVWTDSIYLSRDDVIGDDVLLKQIRHNGKLVAGQSYTDAATVNLPDDFFGSGFLYVVTDTLNEVYEFNFESNNRTDFSAIEVLAPDLEVTAELSTFSGVFGDTIPLDYTVTNTGDGSAFASFRERIWLSSDRTLNGGDRLLATVDADQVPLAAGQSYTRNDLLVNLPLDASLAVGDYYLIVETDFSGVQAESDDANNVGATVATISLDFPPLPDLQVQNVSSLESAIRSGDTVTVIWQTVNAGSSPVLDSLTERIVVRNTDTGGTLLSTTLPLAVSAGDPIGVGEVVPRQLLFDLPDGIPGAGNINVSVTTDWQNQVVESFTGNTAETNNTAEGNFASLLPPYPDLIVENLSATPTTLLTGETLTLGWDIGNIGTAAAETDFQQRIRITNTTTGMWIYQTVLDYDVSTDGSIADGDTRGQSRTIKIPNGSGSVGDLSIAVTVDSSDAVFELNPSETAESNNAAATPVTTSLAPYPDLAVSGVVAPTQTIADPANVTVSWQVDNLGTLAAEPGKWFDAVIASTDEIIGDGDDRIVAQFERTESLAAGGQYSRTETFQLPPAFTGRFYLYVQTDVRGAVFEDGRLANNADRAADFFDVMPIPYADLLVTSVTPAADGASGQPMEVSWRVENQGIGLTNRSNWNDVVYLATDPAGNDRVANLGSFRHLGQLAVGDGYNRTETVTLPNGITGPHYIVVSTAGNVFEFIHDVNNTTVSDAFEITLTEPPDLIVTDIQSPTEDVLEGTLIDVSWTVKNDGVGVAGGSWEDRVYLRKVGDPSAPIVSLGTYRYSGPLQAGTTYTRQEQVRLPVRTFGLYETVVITNYRGELYEHGADDNNTRVDDTAIPITVRPRPDLQISDFVAPDAVDPGQTVAVDFTVINQGTVATTRPNWQDRVYLSLDPEISSDDVLIASTTNQSALEPGQEYRTITESAVVPLRFRGTVYLIVQADAGGEMEEWPNDGNNTFFRELYVTPQPLPDLVTGDVVAPVQAVEGATVEVRYTVSNLGPGETPVANWTDTVWLTRDKNRPHPGQGDVLLKSLSHSGSLVNKAGYDVVTNVTLPTGLVSGTYYITPWTDPYAVVLEDTLAINVNPDDPTEIDNNNYKARAIDIIALSTPDPDLTVREVMVDPSGVGGEQYTVAWKVFNEGKGDASGSWVDEIWLTDDPDGNISIGNSLLLARVPQSKLGDKEAYEDSVSVTLTPSATGSHIVVVTDAENRVGETDENNNRLSAASEVTPRAADLEVVDIQVPTDARSGEEATIRFTIENTGIHPVWSGTDYWTDYVWISADVQFIRDRASYFGQAVRSNASPLAPGEQYSVEMTGTLPEGIGGDFFVYVHPNTHDPYRRTVNTGWWPAEHGRNDEWLETFSRWAFEDPRNNVLAAPMPVQYYEPDLVVSDPVVPAGVTSGETVTIAFTVTNEGTRATRSDRWIDRVFLSKDPSLDRFDTMIGETARYVRDDFLEIGESYIAAVDVRIPDGIDGDFYVLMLTDSPASPDRRIESNIGFKNQGVEFEDPNRLPDGDKLFETQRLLARGRVLEYQLEGNNTIASTIDVTLAATPDLQVTEVLAPERVRAGQPFDVTYTAQNFGGDTPASQSVWNDLVYLSRDRFLDLRADRFLGTVRHEDGLSAGVTYSETRSYRAPSGFADETEEYYVFVVTDPARTRPTGDVFELGAETNNDGHTVTPVIFELPPPTDLQVTAVAAPQTARSGEAVSLSWTVQNTSSEPAVGSWSDTLYLSADATWDISDVPLGRVAFSGTLAPDETYSQTLDTLLPPATPGQYRVITRTDIFNQVYEREFDANNALASSETLSVTVDQLQLGTPFETTLSTGQSRLFQVTVPHDQTLRVSLSTEVAGASNEIFLRYDAAPTIAAFDAAYEGGLDSNLQAVIPSTEPGTYYVLIRGFSQPEDDTPVRLLAELLPLVITDVNTDVGGDSKFVTTTVEGARFDEDAIVKLIRPGFAEFVPVVYEVVDSTKILATFDFTDAPHGLYDVTVINPGDEAAVVPYRFLVEQAIEPDVTIGVGGPRTILAGDMGTYSVALQSVSNLDTPYVHFEVGIPEMLTNQYVYGLPFVRFNSNVRGAPDGADDVPWAQINSVINAGDTLGGTVRSPGYLFDQDANGFTGFSFNLSTYPGLEQMHDRAWEELVAQIYAADPELEEQGVLDDGPDGLDQIYDGLTDIYNSLAAVPSECEIPFIPFRFHLVAAATAMTREEFVEHSLGEAETLRQAIIDDDSSVTPALTTLAANRDDWGNLFLAALEQGGLLRDVDEIPPIREQEKIVSVMGTLSAGILIGPAGQEVRSSGNLLEFFDQVRQWYGHDPNQMGEVEFYDPRKSRCQEGEIPVPAIAEFEDYDLGLSQRTHFESFRVYVPWMAFEDRGAGLPPEYQINGPQPVDGDEFAGLDLTQFLDGDAVQGLASITGPQTLDTAGWLPLAERLPYSVSFANSPEASQFVQEVRVVTQLDDDLDIYSFRLGDINIGKIDVNIPSDRALFQGEFDFTESEGFILRVSAGIDQFSREATWLLQAIDPLTGELLQDPSRGLLAPNNARGDGDAFVSYTILPDADVVETGSEVSASARVLFNNAPPEETSVITQPVDATAPSTALTVATVAGQDDNYLVDWSATDDPDGSGLRHVTLYVATDGGDFKIWQRQLVEPSGSLVFEGEAGSSYEFLALAADTAGNRETPGLGKTAEGDGTTVNLGAAPSVPDTTPPNFGMAPEPSPEPSTSPLFVTAEQLIPAAEVSLGRPEFDQVLRPFLGKSFVTGIEQSFAEIGPMAIAETPAGDFIVSGGASRSSLFRFGRDGGEAFNAWAELPYPIFNLAFDGDGRLWATTGGGPLLELDPDTGAILAEYGEGITMGLAIDPVTGLIYAASGAVWSGGVNGQSGGAGGVQIFDPVAETFTRFSRDLNLRAASLAFDPQGNLWATTWPDRSQVVRFTPQRRGELMLEFDSPVDSLAFGQPGTELEGLMFVSHNEGGNDHPGSELTMIDLATLRRVSVADGGSRGDVVVTTSDGRVLVSQSNQVDVLNPAVAPLVLATNPPTDGIAVLPISTITVTFDQQMYTGVGGEPNSVLNPDNFVLVGDTVGEVSLSQVIYIDETNTAHLLPGGLEPDTYALTVESDVTSVDQLKMERDYATTFTAVQDFSAFVDIRFDTVRSDRAADTVSWDVIVTNTSDFDLQLPVLLILDPADGYPGVPQDAVGQSPDGRWYVELTSSVLQPGDSTPGQTVTVDNENDRRVDLGTGVAANPGANQPPVFETDPLRVAAVGGRYEYDADAIDPDGVALQYFLFSGPEGMRVEPDSGLVSWNPTLNASQTTPVELHAYDTRGGRAVQRFEIAVTEGNRPPTFNELPSLIEGQEGEPIEFPLSVTDLDGDPLAAWVDQLPPGAVLDPVTLTFRWTPDFDSAGTYQSVAFNVSDGIHTVTAATTFAIAPGDQPPTLVLPPDRIVREGDRIRMAIRGFDPDGGSVEFSSHLLPPGATLHPTTGVFDWTPDFFMHRDEPYVVPITVTSGEVSVTETMSITVINANGAPVFDDLTGWRIFESQPMAFSAFAYDPDNPGHEPPIPNESGEIRERTPESPATVTYAVEGLPPGATFDPLTTLFFWQPEFDQAGTYELTFTATDDGDGTGVPLTVESRVSIEVMNLNRAPEIDPIANQMVSRDNVLEIPVNVTDPDGNPLSLSAENAEPGFPLPEFVTFTDNGDGTGLFRLTPTVGDRGDYGLTVLARDDGDGGGRWAEIESAFTFIATVDSPNEPPRWDYIGDKVAVAGEPFELTVHAVDPDEEPLDFDLSGLPAAATITADATYGSATIRWTPQTTDIGVYTATVNVDDGGNGQPSLAESDASSFSVVVRAGNATPSLSPLADRAVDEGDTLSFVVAASDPDGDPLTYRGENLPEGATIDPASGQFTWTPSYQQAGLFPGVRVVVGDGHRSRFQELNISVANTNRGPIIVPREPLFMREGGMLEFTVDAGDVDGDPLAFSATGLPDGAEFSEDGRFRWTPGYEQAGEYVVRFTATDPSGLSDSTDVTLRIDNINRAPQLDTSFHAVRLGEELRFNITATDPDLGTMLTYDANDLPEGATVDPTSGELVWTPGPGQDGEYLVRVFASDGQTTTSQVVVILAATELPSPEVSVVLTPSFPSPPGEIIQVAAIADSLADIASVAVTLDGQPVTLDENGRGEISVDNPGRYEVVATATDLDGLVGVAGTILKVRDPADVDAPLVELDAPEFQILTDGVIRGTISDLNLDEWTLEMRRVGESDFVTIAVGNDPVVDGVLATVDPRDLPNDFYELQLSARDISRRLGRAGTIVELYSESKNNVIVSEVDLTAEVGGVTIDVGRQYDSIRRGTAGDFGNGWRMLNREVNFRASVRPTGFESQGLYSAYRSGTRLLIDAPSGEQLGFVFEPVAQSIPGFTYYTAAWQPLATDPVGWTLESPELKLIRGGDQFFELATGYPYNPSSPLFPGDDFRLVAPDTTAYDIDARLGITQQTASGGVTLYLGDSGVVATGGESIQFVTDGSGRVSRVIGPAGEIVEYRYDASGNLVSVRQPESGQTRRYGYSNTVPGRLELAVGNTSGGLAFEYPSSATPVTSSVEADLGAAASYTGQTLSGDLAAGGTQRFAFSVRQSELDSTSTGELLVRIVGRTSGGSQVDPPEIPGLVARSTQSVAGRSEAVYSIGREGLYQFAVSESGGMSGTLDIELMVAGDVNQDLTVDGLDSDAVAASIGLSEGDAGYDPRADVDGSGTIEIDDRFLLLRNSGFVANAAPVEDPAFSSQMTHQDLALQFALTSAVIDPDGDPVNYRLLGAQNGSVTLSPDGTEVTFVPDPGFTGAAAVELVADDGFNASGVITLDINVSDAELLDIEIVSRQPTLGIGDRSELVVLGDFGDQQDVPLIGDYLSYVSTDPSVLSVDGQGKLFAAVDGYAAITVSRGELSDATAATVGTPFDELNRDDGIFVYPGSLTLPLVSGQRQFIVETLDGETDLSSAASGVLYVLGDSRVVDLTEDGLMTSAALGSTTLTIISGPAEVTVPIRVIEPEIGSATFGSDGGLLQSSDGTQLQIPPGALPEGVQVSLDPLPIPDAADLPRSEEFTVGRAFQLDFSGQTLKEAAQLAVPVGTEFQEGDTVYFMQRQELTDLDGSQREFWLIVETGIVGSDGFARTTSPPYPGFSAGGRYIAAKSDQPEKLVTIGGPARNHEGFSLALDWNNGIGVTWGGGFIPIIPALTPVITIATYRRNPLTGPDAIPVQQLDVDVSAATPGQVFTPAVSFPVIDPADSAPVITNIRLTSVDPPVVQLTGQRFAGSEVIFRYRGNDISAGVVASDTSATVPVPAGVIAGLADILITHPVHGESNASRLTSPGGLGAVGRTGGGIAVFDTNTNTNSIVKEFNFGGGSDTLFTTDLTRLYAATFRHGIGVVDTITLKQMPPISLPGNAFHHQITTDPGDRFLFVGGPTNTLYIVDIRPESPTFHQTISSIVLPRERVTNSGIAVNADGTKLLVGSGTEYDDGYLTVFELDWDAAPTGANPSSARFATLLSDQQVAGIPLSVNATSDPDHATITYRYQVSSYTPWGGNSRIVPYMLEFGAVTLTDSGFSVDKVRTLTPGGLNSFHQSFPYSGYYTDIFTPRDVVVTPDLSAAFIANWELLLISGYGGQRGDKVGVVSDPFGKAAGPEYLGSTTPIDFGCTTSVALNSDGSRVFASYGCLGETLVMDTDALISTGLSRSPSERERLPLDLVGSVLDPDINPGVHLTPISTGGLVQGLSTQGGDFFSVIDFGSGPSLDRVELEYEITTPLGVDLSGPVDVTLRAIPQRGEGMPAVVGTIEIHPDNIGSGGLVELVGENASDALKSGIHKLVLDPSQIGSLTAALEDEDFELIQASADPSVAKFDASFDFAGYYQQSDGARGVLRTGSQTKDTVDIDTDDSISWSSDNVHPDENTSFVSASDILIVTADKKDWIHALGDADEKTKTDLIVLAGLGNDFVIGGRGDDRLDAGSDTGTGLFDFNVLVGMGGDDHLEGSETKDVMFGDGFELGVSDLESFAFDLKDGKFNTPSVGLIPVGNGEDTLIGNDGFDVMFGGHNTDTLKPGEGSGSLMFGDTFELSVGGAIDISPLYDFTDVNQYFDELAAVASQLDDFFSFSPEFAGDGGDKIFGGGTFDMFFGGDGMDEIDVSASTMALGWGGPGKDTITGPKRGGLIFGDDLTPDQAQSLNCGTDCNDTITATPGSIVNFFIAGEGDDTVTGGGRLDLIIGDAIDVDFEGAAKWGAS